jgi:hypothetical protein
VLFEAVRHEALTTGAWDPDQVRRYADAIVQDIVAHFDPASFWPRHPLDASDDDPDWYKSLYLGAAGTLWALHYLAREGVADPAFDPADAIGRVHGSYLEAPDTGSVAPSYYLGEVGILLVRWRLTQDSGAADRLEDLIRGNIPNPTNEALWAAPGTMVGALHMHGWTGETRWLQLFLENTEQLWSTWLPSRHAPCHLWTQDLYGSVVDLLGAGHGFAGNVYPLLRGARWLPEGRRDVLYARCLETLLATAIRMDGCANWPQSVGPTRPGRTHMLLQWCHGSPGMITGLADLPAGYSGEIDSLLLEAGETAWRAGPLAKGYGLCHGTAGNGYAFLKLHRRTGDAKWLDRARAFAVHAMHQRDSMRAAYGVGRYSLWTGDAGLAIYLWHCIKGVDAFPSLDVL